MGYISNLQGTQYSRAVARKGKSLFSRNQQITLYIIIERLSMKTALILWVFCLVWIAGCGDDPVTPSTVSPSVRDFILKGEVGKTQIYLVTVVNVDTVGIETREYDTLTWKILAKNVTTQGATLPLTQYLEITGTPSGQYSDSANYYGITDSTLLYYSSVSTKDIDAQVLLKTPLSKGNSWISRKGALPWVISQTAEQIKVPAGTFQSVHVETHDSTGSSSRTNLSTVSLYFAPDVLLSKSVRQVNSTYTATNKKSTTTVTTELLSVK